MKKLLLIILINFLFCSFGQSMPQMHLKTSTYQPSTFPPSTYTPQSPDYSILQRSMQQREERANNAYAIYNKLIELYVETEKAIPPTEHEWFSEYAGAICKNVKDNIEAGNYQSAIRLGYDAMSTLRNDKRIVYRKDSYKKYCDDISFKGCAYTNGKVNKETYDWWLYENQYKFMPKYDISGNLNGYVPVNVSWLYESINWSDVYNFVNSRGVSNNKKSDLWDLYFMDGGKSLSLSQEYSVNKFYLEYYLYVLEHEKLNDLEHTNLKAKIDQLSKLLLNSENTPTYEAFVNNVKNNIIK